MVFFFSFQNRKKVFLFDMSAGVDFVQLMLGSHVGEALWK